MGINCSKRVFYYFWKRLCSGIMTPGMFVACDAVLFGFISEYSRIVYIVKTMEITAKKMVGSEGYYW